MQKLTRGYHVLKPLQLTSTFSVITDFPRILRFFTFPGRCLLPAVFLNCLLRLDKNKKAQLMLAYPRDAKTKKIPPFRSYNKFQSSRKSGVYSN